MTKVIIEDTNPSQTTFEELSIGDAYYSLDYPDALCIKATDKACLFYDKYFQKWDFTEENPSEPVHKIDAEIKFMY